MMRWDDIRYFLAVSRSGGPNRAARALGVDYSTVVRRIEEIERALQTRLFEHRGRARELTDAGREMLTQAERIEASIRSIELEISSRDQQRAGTIKVSTPDGIAVAIMPELAASFRTANPDIRVELVTGNTPVDLLTHEADVELRPTRRPMREARGRKLARIPFAIYGATANFNSRRQRWRRGSSAEEALAAQDWIFPDPVALPIYAPADWLRSVVPRTRIVATVSSAVVMLAMAEQGLGIACLPCYLAKGRKLQRLLLLDERYWGELWLLTHPHLSRVARVRAFLDHAANFLASRKGILE